MWQFYKLCLKRAFTKAWSAANAVALVATVAGAWVISRLPQFRDSIEGLDWMAPVAVFALWFLYRFSRAPFELFNQAEQRAAEAISELKEHRDCQAIADYLTKEHEYGIHQLLHKPPQSKEQLAEWNRVVQNWNEGIFARLDEFGCTPQDLNHVRTIASTEVMQGLSDADEPYLWMSGNFQERWRVRLQQQAKEMEREFEIPLRMHAIRLTRIADISNKYVQRAEQLKLAASINLTKSSSNPAS